MEYKVITNPPTNWMERLRRGHWVWLVKEKEPAQIEFPYEPPEPGLRTGRVGIRRFSVSENRYRDIQSWFIGANGEGINGSQLMLPTEGNLPDNPEPLPEPTIRQILRTLEKLDARISALEDIHPAVW